MRRLIALVAAISFAFTPVYAAGPKPRGCFTKAEQNAQEIILHGVRLREGGTGCEEDPWNAGTLALWKAVDEKFGPQFKQQTDIRKTAFVREFGNDAEYKLSIADSRMVFYFRQYPLSFGYCGEIKKMLTDTQKNGWGQLVKQAGKFRDPVRLTYTPCDQ